MRLGVRHCSVSRPALVLTGLVWIVGQRLAGVELAPDRGASWYYWQLPHPSGMDSAVGLDRIRAAPTQRLGSDLLRPVTFTARNYDRGAAALSRLRREKPRGQLSLELCELTSVESIKSFARKLVAEERPVHALVHNAGVLRAPAERQPTASGIEITRATNAFGPARLTTAVLPALAAAPVSRVLILTSRLHQPGAPREPG